MDKLTVVALKELAKSKGLSGYSKLRKQELIDLLAEKDEEKVAEVKIEDNEVVYGSIKCQNCNKNLAYYKVLDKYVCGICSKSSKERIELPKNEAKKRAARQKELEAHNQTILNAVQENKANNRIGTVICTKLLMMRNPELKVGFLNIFPNNRHQNRADGVGMPSLSPMRIKVPQAKNLENFWQFSKVFPSEIRRDSANPNGDIILDAFFEERKKAFEDDEPHRHKRKDEKPVFSYWIDKFGKEHRLSYVESRQVYCYYYTKSVLVDPEFLKLKDLIQKGYNLNIVGYDAYMPTKTLEDRIKSLEDRIKSLEEHYLDGSKPFGHELVLYTLLVCKESEYPWIKHKTIEME